MFLSMESGGLKERNITAVCILSEVWPTCTFVFRLKSSLNPP